MLSESEKLIFLQIKYQNEFLRIQNEFPTNNEMFSECVIERWMPFCNKLVLTLG